MCDTVLSIIYVTFLEDPTVSDAKSAVDAIYRDCYPLADLGYDVMPLLEAIEFLKKYDTGKRNEKTWRCENANELF